MEREETYLRFKDRAYGNLLQKRRGGTRVWISMLENSRWVLGKERAELLLAVNAWARWLDDIADGDMEPLGGMASVEYLSRRREVLRGEVGPEDDSDEVMLGARQLAGSMGIDIDEELEAFLEHFLFDAGRMGTRRVFEQAELDRAYDECLVKATVRGGLKVFGLDPDRWERLRPLAGVTRRFYTLRDWLQDIKAGMVNISGESMRSFRIAEEDLGNRFHPNVRSWFRATSK